jgi:hypothetical protein
MFERTDPRTLMKWLIVTALVYFLWPYDLLPDFLGLPGRIDDVVIMGWLAWFYRNHLRQTVATGSGSAGPSANTGFWQNSSRGSASEESKPFDVYEILGVSRSASDDAIRAAYRARMKEYHPDKVAHLGEELQQLANEKPQQIQRAYRELDG